MSHPTLSKQLLVRPQLEKNESLRGYLARLSDHNLSAQTYRAVMKSLSTKTTAIPQIAALSGYTQEKLITRGTWIHDEVKQNSGMRFGNTTIPHTHVRQARRMLCPVCMAKDGLAQCTWELQPYDVCHRHGCYLIKSCNRCKRPFSWSSISTVRCTCGFPFSKNKVEPATSSRQGLCLLIADVMEHTIAASDNNQDATFHGIAPIDWLFILNDFIHALVVPYFWKKHLQASLTLDRKQCESLVVCMLTDKAYCEELRKNLALHCVDASQALLKIFQPRNTLPTISRYFARCLAGMTFHECLWRLEGTSTTLKRNKLHAILNGERSKELRTLTTSPSFIRWRYQACKKRDFFTHAPAYL